MSLEHETIQRMVTLAFVQAASRAGRKASVPARQNAGRSRDFVAELAQQFVNLYSGERNIKVLSLSIDRHRNEFGANEVLFDITVCRVAKTESARRRTQLTYVTESLWAVESEFARNSRSTLQDFNKLVLSNAKRKLFVCSQVSDQQRFLTPIAAAAANCSGELFVATVPHPSTWHMQVDQEVPFWDLSTGHPEQVAAR